jgi:hypothetical protein
MNDDSVERSWLRRSIYALLISSSLATMCGRILSAQARDGQTPFFSANDRSRWSTVSALVDYGTYSIDQVRQRRGWKSIDMVRHRDRRGEMHYYSSKPPLMATVLALPYGVIKAVTGATFEKNPFAVGRAILLLIHIPLMWLFLTQLAAWAERNGSTDWGRIFVVACGCWATLLTPFTNTLNNHLPAAVFAFLAVVYLERIWRSDQPAGWWFGLCGLCAALAAATELPALALAALIGAAMSARSLRATVCWALPAMLLVAAAFFLTNYIAHDSWIPPYGHRGSGENWYDYPGSYWIDHRKGVDLGEPSQWRYLMHVLIGHHGFFSLTPIWFLSLAGAWMGWSARDSWWQFLIIATLGLFVVCLVFYVGVRPQLDRNYGGVACGFRWLFWLIPLWLMLLIPAADWLSAHRARRWLGLVLLIVSIASATIGFANPWSHPWIYQLQGR